MAGGGVHTNSFAMIMLLCVCGSSLHASSSLYTIYGLTNDTVLIMISYPVGVKFFILFF